jgi:hypothetical protein
MKRASEEPATSKKAKGILVNTISEEKLQEIINYMKANSFNGKKYIEKKERGWVCNLTPTKTAKGEPKYPQFDITKFGFPKGTKVLVHHLYWRYRNNGIQVDESTNMHISHLDADPTYIECVQESVEMNESRKYCHLFEWYKTKEGEDRPRCPHWEAPCTGPK